MTTPGQRELTEVCMIASEAGAILRDQFHQRTFSVSTKTDGPASLVTEADLRSDAHIRSRLQHLLPGVTVESEERESPMLPETQLGLRWIVDPLDGTLNFSHGYPEFAVSIALWDGAQPLMGVVHHPLRAETWSARTGIGAFWNGQRISAAVRRTRIENSLAFSGWPYDRQLTDRSAETMGRLMHRVREVRVIGSAALAGVYVASGIGELFFEIGLAAWDLAAAVLIARESGCAVTNVTGDAFALESGSVLITSEFLLSQVVIETAKLAQQTIQN